MLLVKLSLAEQARNALLEEIASGRLPGGTRLTEEAISTACKISRTPVREALRRLENDGLIEPLPGRGYQVKKLDIEAIDELLSCRLEVEMRIFSADHRYIDMTALQKLHAELSALDPAAPDALSAARILDDALHNIINEACRNRYWRNIHAQLLRQRLPYRDIRNSGGTALAQKLKTERLKLLSAMLSGDVESASVTLFEHLQTGRQELLDTLRQNTLNQQG